MSAILVVDDDVMTLRMLEFTLSSAGHTVVATTEAEEAAALAADHEVDAVILDVMMPGRSGYEVLAELHNNPQTARLPVLMLSALAQSSHRVKGLREGADEYIGKPFDPEELVLRLNRLLSVATSPDADLQGRLETVPFAEVAQSLLHSGREGLLELSHQNRRGELFIEGGRAKSATYGRLHDKQAVLAMLELRSGSFRFSHCDQDFERTDHGVDISLQESVFTAAWLHDEMQRWPEVKDDDLLWAVSRQEELPELSDRFHALPMHILWQEVSSHPGISVKDAIARELAAPKSVRLAAQVLVDTGVLRTAPPAHDPSADESQQQGKTTSGLEGAVGAVMHEANSRGFTSQIVHLLLLAVPSRQGELLTLRQQIPATALAAPGDSLAAAWRKGRIAEIPLQAASGQLVLHITNIDSPTIHRRIQQRIGDYAAVVVWVDQPSTLDNLEWVVQTVESSAGRQWGVVLCDEAEISLPPVLDDCERWRMKTGKVSSFAGLLRLIANVG